MPGRVIQELLSKTAYGIIELSALSLSMTMCEHVQMVLQTNITTVTSSKPKSKIYDPPPQKKKKLGLATQLGCCSVCVSLFVSVECIKDIGAYNKGINSQP